MRAVRLSTEGPIIRPDMDGRMGDNINGPALIRAPQWLPNRLGEYYLYFADHKGSYIRLAVADDLLGPWRTHEPGALQLAETAFPKSSDEFDPSLEQARQRGHVYPHIASPDAVVDDDAKQIRLYFHGQLTDGRQVSRVALSSDGITFEAGEEILSTSYLRMIHLDDVEAPGWFGMSMPGIVYRSDDGLCDFEQGPQLFPDTMRHCALLRRDETLFVFWTNVGDTPERNLCPRRSRSWATGDRGLRVSIGRCCVLSTTGKARRCRSRRACVGSRPIQCMSCAIPPSSTTATRCTCCTRFRGSVGIGIAQLDAG